MLDVAAAVDHVAETGPVAVIGYCFGGSIAWIAACDLPIAAAVGYYGGQIHGMIDRTPKVPTMLHFGELDHGIPLDQVEAIAAAHPDVPVNVYLGAGHGFSCDARDSYDARSRRHGPRPHARLPRRQRRHALTRLGSGLSGSGPERPVACSRRVGGRRSCRCATSPWCPSPRAHGRR